MSGQEVPRVRPAALVIGPLPPPYGGVGVQVEALLRSPLSERWRLSSFNLSKPQQEGKPSTVTAWDVLWTLWHVIALPARLARRRYDAALVESTADTGFLRDLVLLLECALFGVPVVLHWHGAPDSPQFPGRASWRRSLFRFGARRAARVVVLAEPYRARFEEFVDADRLTAVPNFVDGSTFDGATRPARDTVTALFVGRVGPQKGTDVLLAALGRARQRAPALRAVFVGQGETPQAYAEVARHPLVREGTVRLAGALGPERAREYQEADFFVLPTRADSLPLAILEAMAAGLPVIASDVGAIRWALGEERCGIVVPPGDEEALAAALERLALEPETRTSLGAGGRRRQQELFDSRHAAEAFDAVLTQAAGAEPSPRAAGVPAGEASVDALGRRR